MRVEKNCEICNRSFIAIRENQHYCQRKCFKKAYYARRRAEDALKPKFPLISCQYCHNVFRMPFDPIKCPQQYNLWRCPSCEIEQHQIQDYQKTHFEVTMYQFNLPISKVTTLYSTSDESPLELSVEINEADAAKIAIDYFEEATFGCEQL
jgi:hypothetical protein